MAENPTRKLDRTDGEFERQMAIARSVMEEHWVALRALALGDQHPEMDIETRLRLAREQAASRNA